MIEVDWKIILVSAINFLILYIILKKLFFSKIVVVLEKRKNLIKDKFLVIKNENIKITEEKEEIQKAKRAMLKEGNLIVENMKANGMKEKKDIIEAAKKEANIIKANGKKVIQDQETMYLERMKETTLEVSVEICKKVLGEVLDERAQGEILDAYIERLDREDV